MSTTEILILVVGALGFLAIGSFICVIIDRLPVYSEEPNSYGEHWDTRPWGEVLGGNSRCSSCGTPVRPYDNIPIVSWLILRGKCRGCGERIPAFHPIVELLCPLLFLGAMWAIGFDLRVIPALWLIPVGVAVSVIDLRTLIVPTRIVWPATAVSVVAIVAVSLIEGEPSWMLNALIGLACFAGPLFLIWFVVPKGMGFGDVRLAVLLGLNLGFYAGSRPMAAVTLSLLCLVLASLLGVIIGVVALGARGRKAQVPFGPSLVIGTFICIALAAEIIEPFGTYALT